MNPSQAHRLHNPLHGGDRQGDLRDEARHQLQGAHLRRGIPQGVQEQGELRERIQASALMVTHLHLVIGNCVTTGYIALGTVLPITNVLF